jgi:hypothetical protein
MKTKTSARPTKITNIYEPRQSKILEDQRLSLTRHASTWVKLILTVKDQDDLLIAMPLARAIDTWEPVGAPVGALGALYFARYTSPTPHIEYQVSVASNWLKAHADLRSYVLSICKKAGIRAKVTFEPCTGSLVHSHAFAIACMLEDQDSNSLRMVADITHWLSNMLGFTYAQEAECLLRSAHLCVTNAVGYSEKAVFQNPFVAYRQAQKARQALLDLEQSKRGVRRSRTLKKPDMLGRAMAEEKAESLKK